MSQVHARAGQATFRHHDDLQVVAWGQGYPAVEVPKCASCGEPYEVLYGDDPTQDLVDAPAELSEDERLELEVKEQLAAQAEEKRLAARREEIRQRLEAAENAAATATE